MIFSEMKYLCYKVNKHKHIRLLTRLFHATCIAHSDLKTSEQFAFFFCQIKFRNVC